MSTVFTLPLMTTEQFFELPEPVGDFTYELHFGELVQVGRAKKSILVYNQPFEIFLSEHLTGISGGSKLKCPTDSLLVMTLALPM